MTADQANKQHIAVEKKKARELRRTQWWKNEISKGRCHYCGKKYAAKDLTMDHVVPLSRGGKSTRGNVVPCCKSCNNIKKYMTPVEVILEKINAKKNNSET
jgi:5-methylcytosine-specific restriction protein A